MLPSNHVIHRCIWISNITCHRFVEVYNKRRNSQLAEQQAYNLRKTSLDKNCSAAGTRTWSNSHSLPECPANVTDQDSTNDYSSSVQYKSRADKNLCIFLVTLFKNSILGAVADFAACGECRPTTCRNLSAGL